MHDWLRRNWKLASVFILAFTWCSTLVLARVAWTLKRDYLFLGFNLGLAAFPMVFSVLCTTSRSLPVKLTFASLWLLFLPNAPYIMTDLMHLKAVDGAPVWYDILMISSCAGTGLMFGYFSIAEVDSFFGRSNRRPLGNAIVVLACFASGFGIYLGRFLRWHSVHVLTSPFALLSDILDRFMQPTMHPRTWGFTIGFGTLLLLGYSVLKIGSEALVQNPVRTSSKAN